PVQSPPPTTTGLSHCDHHTTRFVEAAIGLAVLRTIAASHTHSAIAAATGAATALTDGFQLQFEVGALFCLAGAVAAAVMLRPQRAAAVADDVPEPGRA